MTRQAGWIELAWPGTGADIITHYNVYRRASPDAAWQAVGMVPAAGDNRGEYTFQDQTAQVNISYEYVVTAVDQYGNESAYSEISAVDGSP